ncbi:MAG: hypothetical protein ACK5ML_03585 [Lachnospiraceae bacterium]
MEKEDFLGRQIDEIREKAKALQHIITVRDTKSREPRTASIESAPRIRNLEKELEAMTQQSEFMKIEAEQNAIKISEEVRKEIEVLVSRVDVKLAELSGAYLEEVAQRTEDSEISKKEILDELKAVKEELSLIRKELSDQIEGIQNELGTKVHTESVQSYRNIQSLIDETTKSIAALKEEMGQGFTGKKFMVLSFVFSLLSFLAVGGSIAFYILVNYMF